ncbi:Uncharacterised protein [Vibrio cholerae]|nr:Uncharacterised protein [Vibrio cholerae]CSD76345.1 Uncharacterised protein [Vibrio cholerae]
MLLHKLIQYLAEPAADQIGVYHQREFASDLIVQFLQRFLTFIGQFK